MWIVDCLKSSDLLIHTLNRGLETLRCNFSLVLNSNAVFANSWNFVDADISTVVGFHCFFDLYVLLVCFFF